MFTGPNNFSAGSSPAKPEWTIRILDTPQQMDEVEALQRLVWPGSETDVIPAHMLLAAIHNGGLLLGAFVQDQLVGILFGFPGFYTTPDGPRLKHHSHILGVRQDWNDKGIGYSLKRAQWQLVRKQGIDRITWTYDPLLSRNAHLNISRLGAVCKTYIRSEYGEMRDELNIGLPSDRFKLDWWLNSRRVEHRLSRGSRPSLTVSHYRAAGAVFFKARSKPGSLLQPPAISSSLEGKLLLVEIPSDFLSLKVAHMKLAQSWRECTRQFFENAFAFRYLVTDFIHDHQRSFYVLTLEDAILQDDQE
jgi:predicted GNAT superfamily acetyltransferase